MFDEVILMTTVTYDQVLAPAKQLTPEDSDEIGRSPYSSGKRNLSIT
jgi:hypothetical protein